jgi:hypothetical protein
MVDVDINVFKLKPDVVSSDSMEFCRPFFRQPDLSSAYTALFSYLFSTDLVLIIISFSTNAASLKALLASSFVKSLSP